MAPSSFAHEVRASEVSNSTVTTETTKIALSPESGLKYTTPAIVVSPSEAVTKISTTVGSMSPHCCTLCAVCHESSCTFLSASLKRWEHFEVTQLALYKFID
jgi:hypothetical protein